MASLLSWLGQKAKAVEAQVNPFDNGATYNTVVNHTPLAPRPAPQPVAPVNRLAGPQIQGVPLRSLPINTGPAQQPAPAINRLAGPQLQGVSFHSLPTNPPASFSQEVADNPVANFVNTHLVQPIASQIEGVGHNIKNTAQAATGNKEAQKELIKNIAPPPPTIMKDGKRVNNPDFIKYAQNIAGGTEGGVKDVGSTGKSIVGGIDKVPVTKVPAKIKPNLNADMFTKENIAKYEAANAADAAKATARQITKPSDGLGKVSAGVEKQLNPPLSQAERLKLGNPEKNPLYGKVGVPQASDAAQAHFNADFVAQHEQTIGQRALKAVNQLSSKDQELLKQVQTKGPGIASQAESSVQFKQALDATRQYYDLRHAYDHYLGIQTPYRANYLRDLVERNNSDAMPLSGGNKTPGYTQAKTTTGYSGVAEALQRDIKGASFNHAKLTYTKGLDEAYPGQIQAGKPYTDANTQLQTPFGQELFTSKELARQINSRAPAPQATGLTGKYDTANAFLKYTKLSGGAFHAFTETGNFIGQQLMSGKLFTEPGSTGKIFKVMFSDTAMRGEMGKLAENGTLDKAKLGGLTWTPSEIKADVNVTPKGMVAKYTGIKALHDATFKRDIPYAKLKTFEQATQGLDPNIPADLLKIRSAAKGVNEVYGGINRIADGLTSKQAKVAARGLLATDFTEGKIRTVIAALSKGGPEGTIARQLIAGKVLLFAGLATAGGALSGEYKGKSLQQVAENILGNFINPTFKAGGSTVSFPATHVSEFGKPLTPLFKSSTDKFSGIKDYANNRLAAVPAEVNQLINNRDYSGQHIYGKETKKNGGGPISPGKTALNVASGVLPIPASQGISAAQGKQAIPAALANVVGLKVRPDTTPAPNSPKANTTNATKEYSQYKAKTPQGYDLQKLSDGSYAYSINGEPHQTVSLRTAQRAIARDAFSNSDSNIKIIGDQVFRKSVDGTVSVTPKIKYDYSLNSATLTQQKKVNNITGYFTTAQKQLQNIQTQLKDPNTDPLDTITLKNEAQTLSDNLAKYQDYGGFTKSKTSTSGIRVKTARSSTKSSTGGSSKTLASFKVAKSVKSIMPKGIKVKPVSYKAPKLRKISVSKIPKFSVKLKKKAI